MIRVALAGLGMAAALAWIVNRLFDVGGFVVSAFEGAMGWLAIVAACLSVWAISHAYFQRRRAVAPNADP